MKSLDINSELQQHAILDAVRAAKPLPGERGVVPLFLHRLAVYDRPALMRDGCPTWVRALCGLRVDYDRILLIIDRGVHDPDFVEAVVAVVRLGGIDALDALLQLGGVDAIARARPQP